MEEEKIKNPLFVGYIQKYVTLVCFAKLANSFTEIGLSASDRSVDLKVVESPKCNKGIIKKKILFG